jgi:nucleoid DNA-binding protein
MAKKDLIKKIAQKLDLTQDLVTRVYDETVEVILLELKREKKANLPYIGTLSLTKTTPRKYTLPSGKTGKSKARKTIKFKPSRKLLKKI